MGVAGIISSIISFQCKEHKPLMRLRTANELLFGLQYLMLGAYTGMLANFVGCVRNIIFTRMVEKKKSTMNMRFLFSVLFIAMSLFTWAGFKSILIGVAKVMSTYAYGSKNTGFVLLTSSVWLFYDAAVKSYAGCVCEIFTLCSIVAGIIRIDILKK